MWAGGRRWRNWRIRLDSVKKKGLMKTQDRSLFHQPLFSRWIDLATYCIGHTLTHMHVQEWCCWSWSDSIGVLSAPQSAPCLRGWFTASSQCHHWGCPPLNLELLYYKISKYENVTPQSLNVFPFITTKWCFQVDAKLSWIDINLWCMMQISNNRQ